MNRSGIIHNKQMLLIYVDPDPVSRRSQVEYIVFGTVGAVCFIVIIIFISCLAVKRRRYSDIIDNDVQAYCISLPTNESLLGNVDTV